MRRALCVLAVITVLALSGRPAAAGVTAFEAFERLRSLAGAWEGPIEGQDGTAAVTYRMISGGKAVLEILFPGTDHEMLSIYLLDGGELRMTHYCAAGNQPRLRLDRKVSTPADLRFVFEGGANLDPAKDGHIHAGRMTFREDGTMRAAWTYHKDGKPAGEHVMQVSRVADPRPATAEAP